ncbi:MAG: phosphohydrolase, partial [Desulfobacca sp.]|uniref:phosphohydrolase n=1 Tax=Desulfobacca sp. TaxID=2067990 RepID=UPI004048FA30
MQCPGQDTRYWKPGAVFETTCPKCGGEMEFFKDEASRRCKQCGERMLNPKMDFGCASYCKYAEQCFGALPPELLASREDLFKDRVAIAVKRYFGKDFKRIGRATRVARHAEAIGKAERGNLAVILSAAYLHEVDDADASDRPTARRLLTELLAPPPLIEEVCALLNTAAEEMELNQQIFHDARKLAELEETYKENPLQPAALAAVVQETFKTGAGRELAAK